jgi:hypothetical protein
MFETREEIDAREAKENKEKDLDQYLPYGVKHPAKPKSQSLLRMLGKIPRKSRK